MPKDQVLSIQLPHGAARSCLKMHSQFGRDQVAAAVSTRGWDSFEHPFPSHFFSCARKFGGLVLDVGANTGFYSLLAACAALNTRVLAIEPDKTICRLLDANVRLSGVHRQVRSFPLALSDRSGVGTLFIPTQEHGLVETSSSLEETFKSQHSAHLVVEIETLDNLVAVHADNAAVTIIKVDVEGHEMSVLRGSTNTISRCRPLIFVEILHHVDPALFSSFIGVHDYVDVPLHESGALEPTQDVKFDLNAWNHAFVPREKLDFFVGLSS